MESTWEAMPLSIRKLPPILVLVLVTGIRRRSSYFFGHRRPGYMKNPMDTLRRSYADGQMTREEYLERKKVFEQEKEV